MASHECRVCLLQYGRCQTQPRLAGARVEVRMPEQMGGTDTCAMRARVWTKTCDSPVVGTISRVPCSVFKLGTPRTRLLLTSSTPPPPSPSPHPPPPPCPPPSPSPPLRYFGHRLAWTPDGFPHHSPQTCPPPSAAGEPERIPRLLWQTGRGNSAFEHNGAMRGGSKRLMLQSYSQLGEGVRVIFHNDSTARRFVHRHCPYAAHAYDCLLPPAYRADLWRYCALYAHGGHYLDAEDALLVPLASLVRPCDTLVLTNDMCPEQPPGGDRVQVRPCKMPAVQISLLFAAPRHPFLRCALTMAIRNVEQGVRGRNTLDMTGPVAAGACLRNLHATFNYSMPYFMAPEPSHRTRTNPAAVAIFRTVGFGRGASMDASAPAVELEPTAVDDAAHAAANAANAAAANATASGAFGMTNYANYASNESARHIAVVRAHAWRARTRKSGYVDYAKAHEKGTTIHAQCAREYAARMTGVSGRAHFARIWEAVARDTPLKGDLFDE